MVRALVLNNLQNMEKQYRDFIKSLVREAGERLMQSHGKSIAIEHKNNDWRDEVTSVDRELSGLLSARIKERFPEHQIYSEEAVSKESESTSIYSWAIDPIDGTSNFARDIPYFSCCIALLERDVPIAGAIYNPRTNELFSFERGEGAFLNDLPIHASKITEPHDAYALFHIGRKETLWNWGLSTQRSFIQSIKKINSFGASALDLSFLAAGRIEIVVYGTMTTRDIAAAIGLVRAAGGEIYTPEGIPVELRNTPQPIIAVANKELFTAILPLLHTDLLPR